MVANSSSVPRRILRNNGMRPMPSGSRRMTSSVTPGRNVGLIMPTTPRQLEKAMLQTSRSGALRMRTVALRAIVLLHAVGRDISLGHITGKRGAIAAARIAAAAAAGALQQEALAGLHLVTARGWRREFLRGGEPDDEARAASRLSACDAARREAALIVAANDGCIFQKLVLAQQAQAPPPLPGAPLIPPSPRAGHSP